MTFRENSLHDWNSKIPEWASERIKNSVWFKFKNEEKNVR
jgi:hypothetical protein